MRTIRPYAPEDWDAVCVVHDLARKEELRLANLEDAFLPLTVAAPREGLFDYTVLVCQEDDTVVGFVAYSEDELAWLYVHPDHFRRGIGRALAEEAIRHMDLKYATIEVLAGNEPARALYHSLYFTDEDLVEGVMPGNESVEVSVYVLHVDEDVFFWL